MIILGIDPGLATLGYGVIEKDERGNFRALDCGVVTTPKEEGLPVVLPSRDAAQETLELLKEHKALLGLGGLMHCYSYSAEMMDDFAALGLCFSFGGTSTFKNAKKVQECVRRIPGDRILSETDCPYLTPVPFRGEFPNEPKNVRYVVDNLATLRNENLEALKEQIENNTRRLFFKLK